MTSRIPELADAEMTPAQREGIALVSKGRGRIPTPYRVWVQSPGLVPPLAALGAYIHAGSSLSLRETELAVLVAARHWRGDYVFAMHARTAREAGLPQDAIDKIGAGIRPDLGDRREAAVAGLAQALAEDGQIGDADFAATVGILGHGGIADVIALMGYFSAVAMAMRAYGVPVPER